MNRRGFLKNFGLTVGAIAIAPSIISAPPKRLIYKVDNPIFLVYHTENGILNAHYGYVHIYNMSLKELSNKYPKHHIYFYEEYDLFETCGKKHQYVRATIVDGSLNVVTQKSQMLWV